ncbi:heme-dependent catalase [Westerdykella ornata]|uniref:Heme-dependent catalase n=1 Tax=Westerdykella ornata TaxID=318751 RepID=A0A6A6JH80_WESOR|nr:heme-dependent catalase [Westerdykella ornata]KAF2276010.1 heme-dependent catalase [Westerdykella ornata]
MPLSEDVQVLETSKGLVGALQGAAGGPSQFRPAHARGRLYTGTFTPTPTASSLSRAPHFTSPSTRLTLRFSSSTGIPTIPDTEPTANPRGLALRFHLPNLPNGHRHHTDIILHSTPSFPTRTGAEFLELLKLLGGGDKGSIDAFLGAHPETQRFLQTPKPSPESFVTERYFGVNAYYLVDSEGKRTAIRYRVVPASGEVRHLSSEDLEKKDRDYLFAELPRRLEAQGPVELVLQAQVAAVGDVVDDATVVWPEEREIVELGRVRIEKAVEEEESLKEQKRVIFDPIPRVEGVEPSADPLLEVRANVYLISGRQRRQAE